MDSATVQRVLAEVDAVADALVEFAAALIRIPTVNPPGERYAECAGFIGGRLAELRLDVEYFEATDRPEHSAEFPRVNVVGSLVGASDGPCVHLNGHFDVVPAGSGWTVDPFGGEVRGGRLYGRGSSDMKSGLAAAVYAASALRQAGIPFPGRVDVSGTVDEESGGFAGVSHLVEIGRLGRERTDYVIIPEPLGLDRISLGHRGVYSFKVTARGRTGHGSMPFLGRSAIDDLGVVLAKIREDLAPRLAEVTTSMSVVPEEARHGSINVNSIFGGQVGGASQDRDARSSRAQTPCVADYAEAVFDRRFLEEEEIETVRAQIESVLEQARRADPERDYELTDLMVVHPTSTPRESPLVEALERAIQAVVGAKARLVASPGTYDQKHFVRIAGIEDCVAYGPGELEQAHQPDESCSVEDIVASAKVMALTTLDLLAEVPGLKSRTLA